MSSITSTTPSTTPSSADEATQPTVRPIPYVAPRAAWPAYAPDQILPGLWQGGTEDDEVVGGRIPADHHGALAGRRTRFDVVVTLYADAQPAPWGVEELRFGFPDADLTPEFASRAIALARHAHRRWRDGERVLVRCQAGVNRSGHGRARRDRAHPRASRPGRAQQLRLRPVAGDRGGGGARALPEPVLGPPLANFFSIKEYP